MWSPEHRLAAKNKQAEHEQSNAVAYNQALNNEIAFLEDITASHELFKQLFALGPNIMKTISWIRIAENEDKREKLIWENPENKNYYWDMASYSASFLSDKEIEKMDTYRFYVEQATKMRPLESAGDIYIKPAA